MLRHKKIDRICCLVLALTLCLTGGYMAAAAVGLIGQASGTGYETRLFDQSYVHTIDIVMDDWEGFLQTCRSEEYAECTLVIDGESYKNIAIRGKGNTSLSSVSSFGNNRYSFKVEFDHYQTGKTYYGLDKLSLNNLIYDNTYMKDYFAYTLMNKMGVASPLCSFAEIRVNGEVWGTYLVAEGVEDAFLKRNYGADHGELYKPDTMNFGGGRGNGRDFDMANFMEEQETESANNPFAGFDPSQMFGGKMPDRGTMPQNGGENQGGQGNRFGMGGGSSETKLVYTDDQPDSYSNIFASAKTDVSEEDQKRLIAALKKLSEGDVSAVNQEAMLRYLAVHDFLQNGDSYTGSMVHNYYLYEENGVLSMIPWDYNLAYGTFQGGGGASAVNAPIDSPVSNGTGSDRPMVDWIFKDEEALEAYHQIYRQFMDECFVSGWFEQEIDRLKNLLTPYVQRDATAFCTYEEFETGVETLKAYGEKRSQSVLGQLAGEIPSTTDGQRNAKNLIDTSELNLSAMGSMGGKGRGENGGNDRGGMNFNAFGGRQQRNQGGREGNAQGSAPEIPEAQAGDPNTEMPDGNGMNFPGMEIPQGSIPGMGAPDGNGMNFPGMEIPQGGIPGMGAPQGGAIPTPTPETDVQTPESQSRENAFFKGSADSAGFAQMQSRSPESRTNNTEQTLMLAAGAVMLMLAVAAAALFKRHM